MFLLLLIGEKQSRADGKKIRTMSVLKTAISLIDVDYRLQ